MHFGAAGEGGGVLLSRLIVLRLRDIRSGDLVCEGAAANVGAAICGHDVRLTFIAVHVLAEVLCCGWSTAISYRGRLTSHVAAGRIRQRVIRLHACVRALVAIKVLCWLPRKLKVEGGISVRIWWRGALINLPGCAPSIWRWLRVEVSFGIESPFQGPLVPVRSRAEVGVDLSPRAAKNVEWNAA